MTATGATAPTIHQKPAMDWSALTGPIESSRQKFGRILGKCLIFVGFPSAAGATYYVYYHMISTPERILAAYDATRILAVASAVGGAALWYFNWLGVDPKVLKQQRRNIETIIETTPLATIRNKNTSLIISNRDLNEWMKYLLQVMTYDQFIESQTDAIFELELEQASIDLLKEKYRAYLKGPCSLGLKTLTGQKAFTDLLDATEQKAMRKLHAEKEAKSATTYQAFIDRNGVAAFSDIEDPAVKQLLFPKFLEHIRGKNLGLILTRQQFAADITGFGKHVQQVVDNEIRKLETFTERTSYKEFRLRNGFEEIKLQALGKPDLIKQKFLELSYADQSSFKEDRDLLNITKDDIKAAMKKRWLSMRFSEILKTEGADFIAYMTNGALDLPIWKAKADIETRALTIQTIVKDYAGLFTAGVLTATDGIISRLSEESAGMNLAGLISTYGDVIFRYGLIKDDVLHMHVINFIMTHTSFYLQIATDPNVSTDMEKISTLGLVSDFLIPIADGRKLVKNEKNLHEQRVKHINDRFNQRVREIDEDMEIRTETERGNVASAEQNLRHAEAKVNKHEQKISSIELARAQFEAQRASAETEKKRKQTQLSRLQEEQARLQREPFINLDAYREELRANNTYCKTVEAQKNNDLHAAQCQQNIASLTQKVQRLESQISENQKLQKELAQLKEEVESFKARKEELQKLINVPIPAEIKGVLAARKAQAQKETSEKNRAELESMTASMAAKEKRLSELTDLLKDKDMASLSRRAQTLKTQISQNQTSLDGRIAQIESNARLPALLARMQQLSSAIETFQSNQQALAKNSQEIEHLNAQIRTLRSSSADAVMHRDIQAAELRIAERESGTVRAEKTAAQRAFDAANIILDVKKVQVTAELEGKKRQRAAEKGEALRVEESSYQASLTQLTETFKNAIATTTQMQ